MNNRDDSMERFFKEMMKEFVAKGFERPGQGKRYNRPGLDDLFDWFEDFRSKMHSTEKEGTVIIEDEDDNSPKNEDVKDTEIKYLKDQVAQLKQQLKDKEELIELLKSQAKKPKKKKD